jgi:drug/metabolite transporter (DMT)-like permease
MTPEGHGQLAGLGAAVLFGCSAPLISTLTGAGSALSIAAVLYGGASLALVPVALAQPRPRGRHRADTETPVRRADWPALMALTVLGGVIGPVALVLGLARLPAASSSLLLNLEAVFTLAIAVLVGREHLGRRALLAAVLTIAGAVVLSEGSLSGASWQGAGLIALATLAWGIDNNLSQRLSLRDPLQIASIKAVGASLPMLGLALLLGHRFPAPPVIAALLLIGALGYGLSIWLDLLALRALGAAREAVIFASAPFVGAFFSVLVLREAPTGPLLIAAGLMVTGIVLLLRDAHSHWHLHERLQHAHRHRHDPRRHDPCALDDPHHDHSHSAEELSGMRSDRPFWHAHEHRHEDMEHAHPHVSDAHHRHRH